MEILDKLRKKSIVTLASLKKGDVFEFANSALGYYLVLWSSEPTHVKLNDGAVYHFGLTELVVKVNAEVVITD